MLQPSRSSPIKNTSLPAPTSTAPLRVRVRSSIDRASTPSFQMPHLTPIQSQASNALTTAFRSTSRTFAINLAPRAPVPPARVSASSSTITSSRSILTSRPCGSRRRQLRLVWGLITTLTYNSTPDGASRIRRKARANPGRVMRTNHTDRRQPAVLVVRQP